MFINKIKTAIDVLNTHHLHFFEGQKFAAITDQPTPEDSRAWSQILISVLWDVNPDNNRERARIWAIRPQYDDLFRAVAEEWYLQRANRQIISNNFQLHPPVNKNDDVFTNRCGDLAYPLLFMAEWNGREYDILSYSPEVLVDGECKYPQY